MLSGNIEAAVELCVNAGRHADAIIIAMTGTLLHICELTDNNMDLKFILGGPELLARTQFRYLKNSEGFLSNIISALVTEDWSGVVAQCTIDSWKECLVAILTHSREQMPMLCEQLAERLLNEGGNSQENIENAILCYICAGNLEKLVEVWPKPNLNSRDSKLTNDLQELIEVVMLLQKAIELQGRNVDVSGKLAEILSRYAGLLAAQGALSSAVTYLGPSDDANVEDLRSRLYYSLGYKQAYATPAPIKTQQFNQPANQLKPQARHSLPNNQVPLPVQQQPVYNTSFSSQNTSSFSSGFSGPPTVPSAAQPWANSTPGVQSWNTFSNQQPPPLVPNPIQAKPLVPPPATDYSSQQPPRPSSVGSQSGSAPTSRSKYLLDPSVQSGPSYGQTNMYTPQMNTNFNNFGQPQLSNFNTAPINPVQANQFTPFVPTPITNNYMSGVPQIELAQQALPQKNPTPPPGWNDPPPLKTNRQPVSLLYFHGKGNFFLSKRKVKKLFI